MNATVTIALITELLANLPTVIRTGEQVIQLITESYAAMVEAFGDRDVSADEVKEIVAKIVQNSSTIQAL